MAQQHVPIYKEQGKTYHADSCDPLIEAVEKGELELSAIGRATYPGERVPGHVLPGLQSVGYWNARQEQSWGLPWHRNEGIELSFLETGSMAFSVDGQDIFLKPGDLAITRPWQPHKLGLPNIGIGRLHWIIIDVGVRQPHQEWQWPDWLVIMPEDLAELTAYLRENEQPVWNATGEIHDCFRQIGKTIKEQQSPSRLAVCANELLLHLLDLFREQKVPRTKSLTDAQRSVELFLSSLEASYADEWTLDSMAQSCGLGVTRFVHYCKRITNQTPQRYLNAVRLNAAVTRLKSEPKKSVTDIAFDCGFSTSQYFATAFRKNFGVSPRQFRARADSGVK
ncbi:HTH-type transcriptional activator RhaS [Pontiella sulfatireligans]|uniref:HTH-type transcriptional activator RhaS n=2 Tax=Pontiella sulfatireligans TaxID=2750658 RepID=A0A6C2UW60_9BACT|nr:HTH-type transcriptional activator RhaS [Pontiella sulfatireligans]